jgi:hypothetical protein
MEEPQPGLGALTYEETLKVLGFDEDKEEHLS